MLHILANPVAAAMAFLFAAEGETAGGGLSAVMSAMDTVIALLGKCWDLMTSNPFLAVCVAAGLLPVGIGIFTSLDRKSVV